MTTTTLMTASQHRARAEQLRKNPSSVARHVAKLHELAAELIAHRHGAEDLPEVEAEVG
jgi:hypothetical protein